MGASISNTTVLIIVTVFVALALVGMVMGVRYTCRGDDRPVDAVTVPADGVPADGVAPTSQAAQAAQVNRNIRAIRDRGRFKDASARASETALLRARLDDSTDRPA